MKIENIRVLDILEKSRLFNVMSRRTTRLRHTQTRLIPHISLTQKKMVVSKEYIIIKITSYTKVLILKTMKIHIHIIGVIQS